MGINSKLKNQMADKGHIRDIKIKTGTLKRNMKDYTSYNKEKDSLEDRRQKFIDEEKDVHDVKKCEEQIEETVLVIAQCKPRIETAIDALENSMATYEEQSSAEMLALLKETPEWEAANVQIAEANAFVDTIEV